MILKIDEDFFNNRKFSEPNADKTLLDEKYNILCEKINEIINNLPQEGITGDYQRTNWLNGLPVIIREGELGGRLEGCIGKLKQNDYEKGYRDTQQLPYVLAGSTLKSTHLRPGIINANKIGQNTLWARNINSNSCLPEKIADNTLTARTFAGIGNARFLIKPDSLDGGVFLDNTLDALSFETALFLELRGKRQEKANKTPRTIIGNKRYTRTFQIEEVTPQEALLETFTDQTGIYNNGEKVDTTFIFRYKLILRKSATVEPVFINVIASLLNSKAQQTGFATLNIFASAGKIYKFGGIPTIHTFVELDRDQNVILYLTLTHQATVQFNNEHQTKIKFWSLPSSIIHNAKQINLNGYSLDIFFITNPQHENDLLQAPVIQEEFTNVYQQMKQIDIEAQDTITTGVNELFKDGQQQTHTFRTTYTNQQNYKAIGNELVLEKNADIDTASKPPLEEEKIEEKAELNIDEEHDKVEYKETHKKKTEEEDIKEEHVLSRKMSEENNINIEELLKDYNDIDEDIQHNTIDTGENTGQIAFKNRHEEQIQINTDAKIEEGKLKMEAQDIPVNINDGAGGVIPGKLDYKQERDSEKKEETIVFKPDEPIETANTKVKSVEYTEKQGIKDDTTTKEKKMIAKDVEDNIIEGASIKEEKQSDTNFSSEMQKKFIRNEQIDETTEEQKEKAKKDIDANSPSDLISNELLRNITKNFEKKKDFEKVILPTPKKVLPPPDLDPIEEELYEKTEEDKSVTTVKKDGEDYNIEQATKQKQTFTTKDIKMQDEKQMKNKYSTKKQEQEDINKKEDTQSLLRQMQKELEGLIDKKKEEMSLAEISDILPEKKEIKEKKQEKQEKEKEKENIKEEKKEIQKKIKEKQDYSLSQAQQDLNQNKIAEEQKKEEIKQKKEEIKQKNKQKEEKKEVKKQTTTTSLQDKIQEEADEEVVDKNEMEARELCREANALLDKVEKAPAGTEDKYMREILQMRNKIKTAILPEETKVFKNYSGFFLDADLKEKYPAYFPQFSIGHNIRSYVDPQTNDFYAKMGRQTKADIEKSFGLKEGTLKEGAKQTYYDITEQLAPSERKALELEKLLDTEGQKLKLKRSDKLLKPALKQKPKIKSINDTQQKTKKKHPIASTGSPSIARVELEIELVPEDYVVVGIIVGDKIFTTKIAKNKTIWRGHYKVKIKKVEIEPQKGQTIISTPNEQIVDTYGNAFISGNIESKQIFSAPYAVLAYEDSGIDFAKSFSPVAKTVDDVSQSDYLGLLSFLKRTAYLDAVLKVLNVASPGEEEGLQSKQKDDLVQAEKTEAENRTLYQQMLITTENPDEASRFSVQLIGYDLKNKSMRFLQGAVTTNYSHTYKTLAEIDKVGRDVKARGDFLLKMRKDKTREYPLHTITGDIEITGEEREHNGPFAVGTGTAVGGTLLGLSTGPVGAAGSLLTGVGTALGLLNRGSSPGLAKPVTDQLFCFRYNPLEIIEQDEMFIPPELAFAVEQQVITYRCKNYQIVFTIPADLIEKGTTSVTTTKVKRVFE